jgi:hypothetical protein
MKPNPRAKPQPISRIPARFAKLKSLDVKTAAEAIFRDMPGRVENCEFMQAMRASPLTGLPLLRAGVGFPGYVPRVTALDSLAMGPDLFEPGPLADWMAFWAAEIARYPYEELGRAVEKIIAHRRAQIPAAAWAHLETWIEAGHPHAARFFEIHRTQNR